MANLPAKANQSTAIQTLERFKDAIVDQLAAGRKPKDIALKLYPDAGKKSRTRRRSLERRILRLAYGDADFQRKVAERAKAQMVLDLIPAVEAMGQRARRGRPDAGKLLLEASGFHNPRVKHDHSGEIRVKLDMPRPKFVESTVEDDEQSS